VLIEHPVPPSAPPPEPIRGFSLHGEWRVARETLRLGLSALALGRLPAGDGAPVVLVPGWRAPESSMGPLRLFLSSRGYDARHWGLGVNRGNPEQDSEHLAVQVERLAVEYGRPVALVGWSLGGVISRETARRVPEATAVVVTFGTPVIGGPTYTPAASVYGEAECERISQAVRELDRVRPIRVPVAAVFTREDRVVSWPACIDRVSPDVRHFEVASSHLSLGLDPDVWSVAARMLHEHTVTSWP
jgi:pimeloyl-ACP methyl ester carboxylesterase